MVRRALLGLGFIIDSVCEHEAAFAAKNERRPMQDRLRRRSSHLVVKVELSGNGDDTGLDASRVR